MLVSFSVENWKSFKDEATLSLIASKQRNFRENLPHVAKHRLSVLPFAAVYGGNASGKSNLVQALSFVRDFVINGTKPDAPIATVPFLLEPGMAERPSRFSLTIIPYDSSHIDWIYEYSFSVTRREVVEEKLRRLSSSSEENIYERRKGKTVFSPRIQKGKNGGRYEFVAQGTRSNQLFLTNSVSQNIEDFRPIYNWFQYSLTLITPIDMYIGAGLLHREGPLYQSIERLLAQLDTGVAGLETQKFAVPDNMREVLEKSVGENVEDMSLPMMGGDRLIASRTDGELSVWRLMARHQRGDGQSVNFRFSQESDGTRRLLDLLPAFADFTPKTAAMPRVYVVDEIDRSLHTLLVRRLIEDYLKKCSPASRWQFLVTTHDVMLMDQNLLRRDEMWLTERDDNGCSSLASVGDFVDVRADLDVAKHYLLGRMGGVPRLRACHPAPKTAQPEE